MDITTTTMRQRNKIAFTSALVLLLSLSPLLGASQVKGTEAAGKGSQEGWNPKEMSKRLKGMSGGQTGPETTDNERETASTTATSSSNKSSRQQTETIMPEAPDPAIQDAPTKERYLTALREYYAYRVSGYQHRQRVFAWQLWSSKVIFAAVLTLVLAGIYFAAVQFHRRPYERHKTEGGEITEFAATIKGIKVSSPVLGVVILVISLAFFYLYLVYVYPIEEIF
jgi:hypothetical protein